MQIGGPYGCQVGQIWVPKGSQRTLFGQIWFASVFVRVKMCQNRLKCCQNRVQFFQFLDPPYFWAESLEKKIGIFDIFFAIK